jgi:hypothetical protein
MKILRFCMRVLAVFLLAGTVWAGKAREESPLRLELDLTDGSHLIGTPVIEFVSLQTSYAKMDVPLKEISTLRMAADHQTASLDLQNGDKLNGVVNLKPITLETVFGKVSIGIDQLRGLRVGISVASLPAGEGSLSFGGVNWLPWRTMFEVKGDKLVSLPTARAGFNYGHGGNGRGAWLMTNIGNPDWKDYSVEVEYCMCGVNPAFNPNGLALDCRGGGIMFHVADLKESWNENGWSTYRLSVGADGSWGLACMYNMYCHVPSGYGDMRGDGERSLVSGKGLKIDSVNGNKFRIDVSGIRIQVWVDGEKIADVKDEKMPDCIGGTTLDHGGVGFDSTHDSMFWIRKFSVKRL